MKSSAMGDKSQPLNKQARVRGSVRSVNGCLLEPCCYPSPNRFSVRVGKRMLPILESMCSLPDLLTPHCIIKSLHFDEIVVTTGLYDLALFKNINTIRVHNGRKPVRDENRDKVRTRRDIAYG